MLILELDNIFKKLEPELDNLLDILESELDNVLKRREERCKNCQYKRAYIGEDNPEHFENWYCLKMPTSPMVYTPCVRILKCPLEKTTVCLD